MRSNAKKIVIIDSDSVCLALTVITIKNHFKHCMINIFSDALLALEFITTTDNHPDIVLTDVHLPRMNGLEFITRINEYFRNTFQSPPPFDIFSYSSYLDFDQICDRTGTGYDHLCALRYINDGSGEKPCSKLPIKACLRKPVNKDMLNFMMDDVEVKVSK